MDNEFWDDMMLCVENKLGEVYKNDPEYQKALQKEDNAFSRLAASFNQEQTDLFGKYIQTTMETGALREKIAFRQGMKTIVSMFFHLMQ